MYRRVAGIGIGLTASWLAAANVLAAPAEVLEVFQDWAAVQSVGATETLCFAMSSARDIVPKPEPPAAAHLYLAFYPKEKAAPEISFKLSFAAKAGSAITVQVSNDAFKFVAYDDRAFLNSPQDLGKLIDAMKAGETLVIRGTPASGKETVEVYSLSGVSSALERAKAACAAG